LEAKVEVEEEVDNDVERRTVQDRFIATSYLVPSYPTKVQKHHGDKGSQTGTLYGTIPKKNNRKTLQHQRNERIVTGNTPQQRRKKGYLNEGTSLRHKSEEEYYQYLRLERSP
jgi:hypothetical protein